MENHKQWISEIFDKAAPDYGKKSSSFFDYFGKHLVELAKVTEGQKVLDVATGRGAVLFPAAKAVGPSGKVVGIDISKEMLKETAQEALLKDMPWIDLDWMDAEQLNFPDNSFDIVFCGFGLFFLPSIPSALSEFKRVLKQGGMLALSTWGKESELKNFLNQEIKNLGISKSLITTPLRSEETVQQILKEARFDDIEIFEETISYPHSSFQDWWDSLWSHATRARFEQLSSDQLSRLYEKVHSSNKFEEINEDLQVFYGLAKKI